jgi:hypothetical protein
MMKLSYLCVLSCCLVSGSALADGSSAATSTSTPDKAAFEAALDACASSAGKDANGQPNMQTMEICMAKKGYTRRSGPAPGPGQNPPPSQ